MNEQEIPDWIRQLIPGVREVRRSRTGEVLTDEQIVELLNAPLYDGPGSPPEPVTIKMYDGEAWALLALLENTKFRDLGVNRWIAYHLTAARCALRSALRENHS